MFRRLWSPSRAADDGFQPRGTETTRLEDLTDAVIGFAITLLIVSLEVPRTFADLLAAMRGFGSFAISFAIIMVIWYEHDRFFRRYGLRDGRMIVLNAVLLFIILFYVYPLKFLFVLTFTPLLGAPALAPTVDSAAPVIAAADLPLLFVLYAAGWTAVFGVFTLFYAHALSQRHALALTPLETFLTRAGIVEHGTAAALGLVSAGLAVTLPPSLVGLSGWVFLLMFPLQWALQRWKRRGRRAVEARADSARGA